MANVCVVSLVTDRRGVQLTAESAALRTCWDSPGEQAAQAAAHLRTVQLWQGPFVEKHVPCAQRRQRHVQALFTAGKHHSGKCTES